MIKEWLEQGATPAELDFSAFRYRCPATGGIPVSTGQVGQLCAPCVLEETDEYVLSRDSLGRAMRLYKGVATIPLPEGGHPVRHMDDWRRIRHLFEFSEARLASHWERGAWRRSGDHGQLAEASICLGSSWAEVACLAYTTA